jgi:hypothetical protein
MIMIMASLLSLVIIAGRAFFYFHNQLTNVLLLDVASLLAFVVLILFKREYIYAGMVTFLPSVSLYLYLQGRPVSDLLLVSFLRSVCVLFHGIRGFYGIRGSAIRYFLALYLLLLSAYLLSNCFNLLLDWRLAAVFLRFLNYLVLTLYACFLFLMVYREEDAGILSNAFLIGAVAYMVAATMGYFYLEKLDLPGYISDITKELFRYPGFSNSNYIGNVIVAMIAIAYSLRKDRVYVCGALVLLTAMLSQSRSVLLGSLIFLAYCASKEFKKLNRRALALFCLGSPLLFLLAYLYVPSDTKIHGIALQYFDRITLATANETIADRVNVVRLAIDRSTDGVKNLLLGVGHIEDGWNPHNSVLQALLLFGIIPALAFLAYCVFVGWRFPIAIFALIASLGEILFFTSTYDFLFFILLIVNANRFVHRRPQMEAPS